MTNSSRRPPHRPPPFGRHGLPGLGAATVALMVAAGCGTDERGTVGVEPADDRGGSIVVGSNLVADAVDQLLANGDVEHGTTTPDDWWLGSSGEGYAWDWSTTHSVSPDHSLEVRRTAGPAETFAYWAQTVPVQNLAGTRLTLTASVKTVDVNGPGVAIAIRGDDTAVPSGMAEAFATTQGRVALSGTEDWMTVTVGLEEFPAGIQSVTVYLIHLTNSSGTVYFDDITLASGEPIDETRLELENGSMDEGDVAAAPWWYGGLRSHHFQFAWSTERAQSPTHSLAVAKNLAADSSFGFWAQTIQASRFVGRSVTLRASIALDDVSGEGVAIAIRGDDTTRPSGYAEAFATTQGSESITGSGQWATYEVTLPFVDETVRSITVYLIHLTNTTGTVYFDDVTLVVN
jgi:hypothetical protein